MLKTALSRGMMTTAANTRKPRPEGTIASVFASLAGEEEAVLPERFAALKREIVSSESQAQALKQSWTDLCHHLRKVSNEIAENGSALIPEVDFQDIVSGLDNTSIDNIKKRGVVITRNVIPQDKAEEWLASIKDYITKNPQVKGFPADDKQVFEIYWSKAQIQARFHPNSLAVQRFLLSLFGCDPSRTTTSSSDLLTPLTYCDRLRIRKPGDSQFALGPHVDGGSIERWEDEIYRKSYEKILQGGWRDHDPWDIGSRPEANMNLYEGPGACGVFRAMQGWTSLSTTGPGEGTLKVYPSSKESAAYMLLRPFFAPIVPKSALPLEAYLDPSNWELDLSSTRFPNCPLGRGQEFNDETHPHLELSRTMVSLKTVRPGDMAWWHCDGIHSVESVHKGTESSSVMYIPAVPLTAQNARYIADQKASFERGIPPPDFPGGEGESKFVGRANAEDFLSAEGKAAMGFAGI